MLLGEDNEEEQAYTDGKMKNDLRGHLNGLYNGVAKIMTNTCQVSFINPLTVLVDQDS